MCTGLFYLAQENFIQAEMAFTEATKQLKAALMCNSPEQRTEAVCDNHSEDNESVDKPGEFFCYVLVQWIVFSILQYQATNFGLINISILHLM